MHPVAFSLGSLQIHWYGITLSLAMALGVFLFGYIGKKRGFHPDFLADVSLWMLIGGIVGARLDSALHNLHLFQENPFWIFNLREAGFAIHGAIFGGALGNILRFRRSGYPLLEGMDLAMAILLPSMALGRIGCFMQGCCYGSECNLGWAINIPGVPGARHPVQLYEASLDLLLWPLVLYVFFRAPRQGQTVCAMLMTYASIRFTTEFFRQTTMWGVLSREQWGSLTIFLLAAVALALFKGPPRFQPEVPEAKPRKYSEPTNKEA